MSRWWSDLRYRLRALFRRDALERDLADELAFHVENAAAKYERDGCSAGEARRRALADFGGLEAVKDGVRDARGIAEIETTLRDLRYAARTLRAKPAFTAGVVLTLALGIGANAVMFGIVDRLLFRPPAYLADSERTHRIYFSWWRDDRLTTSRNTQFARYLDVLQSTHSFSSIAAFQTRSVTVGRGADARPLTVDVVSGNYFDFFTARPAAGRFLTPDDDRAPSGSGVAVISYAFWQANYGGRPDAVGSVLQLGNVPCTIVGVAPEHFVGLGDEGIPIAFMPITTYAASLRPTGYTTLYTWSWMEMMARRKPDVTEQAATADLTQALGRSWAAAAAANSLELPVAAARPTALLAPVQLERGPQASAASQVALWVSGVAMIVLLIACANVTNLLLSRAIARRREIAVRLALGAGRARLARQLLTETLVLAAAGCAAGLALAEWGGGALRTFFFPPTESIPVFADARTVAFAAVIAVATAVVTGVAPIMQGRRWDIAGVLKSGGHGGGLARSRTRTVLLIAQTALSVVLLVGAGLFVRSLYNVRTLRLGYDVESLIYVGQELRTTRLTGDEQRALTDRVIAVARSMPEVVAVTPAVTIPFWSNEAPPLFVAGIENVGRLGRFLLQAGSPEYFAATGTRILRGRGFSNDDRADAAPVAVVTTSMARTLWPGRDAIGQCFHLGQPASPCTIVIGISEDVRSRMMTDDREFMYFIPAAQRNSPPSELFVRVRGDARDSVDVVRRQLQPLMPGEAFVSVRPIREFVEPTQRSWRFGAIMSSALGLLALVLAAIGLYSAVAYALAQRTKEMGVRIALGASAYDLIALVVGQGVRVVFIGVVIGTLITLWASRWLETLLFSVSPRDPAVFLIVGAVLLVVAVAASLLPAVEAARVDPTFALRVD